MNIKLENIFFNYQTKKVIENLNLEIKSGEFLKIIGPNGSGKTTLAKILMGLVKFSGNAFYDKRKMCSKKIRKIGYVPQKPTFNFEFPVSVKELLKATYLKKDDTFFYEIINKLHINHFFHQNINTLSGGEQQRVFIARALLNKPEVLILDEPTVAIDKENLDELMLLLKNIKSDKITIILITHDPEFSWELTDKVLMFFGDGTYEVKNNDK